MIDMFSLYLVELDDTMSQKMAVQTRSLKKLAGKNCGIIDNSVSLMLCSILLKFAVRCNMGPRRQRND